MTEIHVLYNGGCPICASEIAAYRRAAARAGAPLVFHDLRGADLAAWGLRPDQAARRLHVRIGDATLSGVDAFRCIWGALPRLRWLAALTGLPGLRWVADRVYDRVAAPALYALHRRRLARAVPPPGEMP